MSVFDGVGVALVTLFDADGRLDTDATAEHAERLVEAGVAAVVVAGSTGEAPTLDAEERVALVATVRRRIAGRVPVVVGTGAPSARQAVGLTRAACDHGADAVLALSGLHAADPRPYYEAVRGAAGDVPVLAYHFPTMAPPGIPVAALPSLPVVGVKDSTGDPDRLLHTLDVYDGDVYVGSSSLLTMAGAVGCRGAVLALANLEPRRCVEAFRGDGGAQRALAPVHRRVASPFPRGLKEALAESFGTSPVCRMG